MRRGSALVATALAMSGCVHKQIGDERPGHVVLAQPPAVLAARGTLPAEPMPAPAVVISAGAMLDWGARCRAAARARGPWGSSWACISRVSHVGSSPGPIRMTLAGSAGSWGSTSGGRRPRRAR